MLGHVILIFLLSDMFLICCLEVILYLVIHCLPVIFLQISSLISWPVFTDQFGGINFFNAIDYINLFFFFFASRFLNLFFF